MSDRIEALVKEIAAKHGIAVGRDDPIMILQTINERLIQDSAAAQQDALDRFKEELESIAHRWGEDARAKAERTLTTALAAGRAAMTKDMQAGAKAAALSARQEIDTALAQLADPIRDGRRIAILNLIAAGMAVFAAALALLSTPCGRHREAAARGGEMWEARRGRRGARGSTGSEAAGLGLGMPSAARRGGRSRPQEASAARSVGAGCGRAGREPCPRARAAQAGQQAPGPCPDPQRSPPPGRRPAIQFRFKVIRPRAHRSSPGRPSSAGRTARRSGAPVVGR